MAFQDISRLMRDVRNLGHKKTARTQSGQGIPSNKLGDNGDFRLHMTNSGLKLYAKYNGKWFSFSPDVDTEDTLLTDSAGKLVDNGSVTFSNGFIMQWGKKDIASTPAHIAFPIEFPNKCAIVLSNSMAESAVGTTNIAVQTYDYTTTTFRARVLGSGGVDEGARDDGFAWLAIGN